MLDFIKNIVSSMKNKAPESSINRKRSRNGTGRAIAFGIILAVSISVAIGCDSQKKSGQEHGKNIEEYKPSPEIPVALESYWDLQKESNCSSPNVKVPSGYAALICGEISGINMINVFVFSWKWEEVKQANKSNVFKSQKLNHQVHFVPLNYRWELGNAEYIKHAWGSRKINLTHKQLSDKDIVRTNLAHASKGATDIFFIGLASREGTVEREEKRSEERAQSLHAAFYAFIPNHEKKNLYGLSFGKYDDNKCPPSDDSSKERPIIIAMISGSGKQQQQAMSIYKKRIEPDLEDKVEKILDKIWKNLKKNRSSGRKFVKPSCYSTGENPEIIIF